MRKPKAPGAKTPSVETPPAGGRAWARVQQFALARGLPLEVDPGTEVPESSKSTSKRKAAPAAGKRTKQVKTARRRAT